MHLSFHFFLIFLDWPLDHHVMSFLISVNSVYFGVHFSDVSMIPNLYFDFFVHGVSFFIPSLSACACLWVWSESPIAAYIWVLFLYQFIYYVFKCCFCCSVPKSCLPFCDPIDCSMQGFPFLHYHPEFVQTHVHWVNDGIQPSHPQLSLSPPALSVSQHHGLFQWVGSSH